MQLQTAIWENSCDNRRLILFVTDLPFGERLIMPDIKNQSNVSKVLKKMQIHAYILSIYYRVFRPQIS